MLSLRCQTREPVAHSSDRTIDGEMSWRMRARWYRFQEGLERPSIRAAVELAGDLDGRRILDAGAGTGIVSRQLLETGVPAGQLTAVDASSAMLAQLRRRRAGVQTICADLRDLPMPDASVDVVFASYVLHIIDDDDIARVLQELRRIIRDGGALITVTPCAPTTAVGKLWRSVADVASRTPAWRLAGLRPLDPADALRQAGFQPERARYVRDGYPSLCIRARACDSPSGVDRTTLRRV